MASCVSTTSSKPLPKTDRARSRSPISAMRSVSFASTRRRAAKGSNPLPAAMSGSRIRPTGTSLRVLVLLVREQDRLSQSLRIAEPRVADEPVSRARGSRVRVARRRSRRGLAGDLGRAAGRHRHGVRRRQRSGGGAPRRALGEAFSQRVLHRIAARRPAGRGDLHPAGCRARGEAEAAGRRDASAAIHDPRRFHRARSARVHFRRRHSRESAPSKALHDRAVFPHAGRDVRAFRGHSVALSRIRSRSRSAAI